MWQHTRQHARQHDVHMNSCHMYRCADGIGLPGLCGAVRFPRSEKERDDINSHFDLYGQQHKRIAQIMMETFKAQAVHVAMPQASWP